MKEHRLSVVGSPPHSLLIEIPTPLVLSGVAGHRSLPPQRMSGPNGCSQLPQQLFWPSGMGETGEGYIRDSPIRPTRIV